MAAQCPVGSAVGSWSATVAPMVATTVSATSIRAGRNASSTSRPIPTTATAGSADLAVSMASNVPDSGARP